MLQRLLSGLAQLVSRKRNDNAPAPVLPPTPTASLQDDIARIALTLKRNLAARRTISAGTVYFISLTEVRNHFGKDWPRVAVKVDTLARSLVQNALGSDDAFLVPQELTYLIVFGRLSDRQARVKCRSIANQIQQRLVGAGDGAPWQVRTHIATLDRAQLIAQFDDTSLLREASPVPSCAPQPRKLFEPLQGEEPPGDPAAISFPATAEAGRCGTEPLLVPSADREPTPNPVDTACAASSEGGRGADPVWVEDGRAPLPAVQMLPHEEPHIGPALAPSAIAFQYRPVWDVRRQAVTTFHCIATTAGRPLSVIDMGRCWHFLDEAMLARACADVVQLLSDGQEMMVAIPVHFDTLADRAKRLRFLRQCGKRVGNLQKYLVCELVGVPTGIPVSRLLELVGYLRRYTRSVIARVDIATTEFPVLKESGIYAVGIEYSGEPQTAFVAKLPRFAEGADRAGLKSYIHSASSLAVTTSAIGAGFHYIDGEAVTSVTGQPERMFRFPTDGLFADVLKTKE